MSPRLAVVVVNWNGKADTLECLASLRADHYLNKEVVVIDNGSRDGSVAAIHEAHPGVLVVEASKNLGFTGGNNLAISSGISKDCDAVLFLNNDAVVDPAAISRLIAVSKDFPSFGILTPLICYFDRKNDPWFAGSALDMSRGKAIHVNNTPGIPTEAVREIPWASGCGMLVRKEVLNAVKGFDDRFYLNWEDVDLSLRTTKAGWKIGIVRDAVAWHKVGRSMAQRPGVGWYYYIRNRMLLVSIHSPTPTRTIVRILTENCIRAVWDCLRMRPASLHLARLSAAAMLDFGRKRFGCREARIN